MAKNVVLILLDDASVTDLAVIKGLAAAGLMPALHQRVFASCVNFANAFASSSLCSPSRASLLSGKYPHNHGVLSNDPPNGGFAMFADADTLATRLQAGGYRTALVGKYLNGYGISPNSPTYVPPGWDDWAGLINATLSVYNYQLNRNGTVIQYGMQYQTEVLADIAAASVTAGLATGKPLYLHVAPMCPHVEDWTISQTLANGFQEGEDPWRWFSRPRPEDQAEMAAAWNYILNNLPNYVAASGSFNEADVSDKPAFMRNELMDALDLVWADVQYRLRILCLLPLERMVSKIATALGATQLANTVFILASDNGFMLGEHRKAQKLAAYEPSIRVPIFAQGPGLVAHTENGIALIQDLYQTILELGGLSVNAAADGRSLMPILSSATGTWGRKRFLVSHTQVSTGAAPDLPTFSAVRTGPLDAYPQRTYVEYIGGELEHYALATDPNELVNTAATAPAPELSALHGYQTALKASGGSTVGPAEGF